MYLVAGLVLLVGAGVTLVSLIVAHVLPTGVNPLRDPVSQYGITPYRGWYWSAAGGAALAGVGGVLFFAATAGVIATVTVILLVVFASARALIGFFPMDAHGTERTRTGRVHNLLATAAFAAVTAAAFTGAGVLHDAGFVDQSAWSTGCGIVMAAGTIGILAARVTRPRVLFGLAERLIYAGFIVWFSILGFIAVS
jgi:hypothetical protein